VLRVVVAQYFLLVEIKLEMRAFSEYLSNLPFDCFYLISALHSLFFLQTNFHLLSVLCLLTHRNLVSSITKGLYVLFKMCLVKANNLMGLSGRNAQINKLCTHIGVLKIHNKPLAESI
jgi:ABC-type microcin C transport system permease subunit YejE